MKHLFLATLGFSFLSLNAYNVGLCVVATGKYINFIKPLIESANKHFCRSHSVTYFVFTDGPALDIPNTITIYQNKLGWPYDTMMRPSMYYQHANQLQAMDYLFSCDADMRFVDTVGDEILHDRVGTLHPGFVGKRGTYETNPLSRAYIAHNEGRYYFAGGFWGGKRNEFLKIAKTITDNVQYDLSKGYIAIWHDESHLNRFFWDNRPTHILSPSYCYPESWRLPYPKKLLALDKNHASMRD